MKVMKFRVARPTDDLRALHRFYVDGLGLVDRGSFAGHDGYDGQLVGTHDESYEIEFTRHADGSPCPPPSRDNLLVFYFRDRAEVDAIAERLRAQGVEPVEPANPYWIGRGLTFADPDGWRVVLFYGQTIG
jgi:catechol 2,3-dioxygenase-like lactoylglutathione lyase family enzyme